MSRDPRLCVIGYASLDRKFDTAPFAGAGRTTLVDEPLHSGTPQPGAVSYFAHEAVRRGLITEVVTWVGADPLGERFTASLHAAGIGTGGVSHDGSRSPTAYMFYPRGGEPVTFFDAGDVAPELTDAQRTIVRDADIVVVMVAPHQAIEQALDDVRPDAVVGWVVKADPGSMPDPLAKRLADRAEVISYSAAESEFLSAHCRLTPDDLVRRGRLVVETHGADGVAYSTGDEWSRVTPGRRVPTSDVTGAGDTFAASLIARYCGTGGRAERLDAVVTDACRDAAGFLESREEKGIDERQ